MKIHATRKLKCDDKLETADDFNTLKELLVWDAFETFFTEILKQIDIQQYEKEYGKLHINFDLKIENRRPQRLTSMIINKNNLDKVRRNRR